MQTKQLLILTLLTIAALFVTVGRAVGPNCHSPQTKALALAPGI